MEKYGTNFIFNVLTSKNIFLQIGCDMERKPFEIRKKGYKKYKAGGIECTNEEELKCQEGIVSDLLKSAGKQLMEGKNVVGISLPVRIFEARSTIERITDWWAFAPIYLNRAAIIKVVLICPFNVFFVC